MTDQSDMKDLLLQVQAGKRNFSPSLPSPDAIAHFQPIARHLKTALDMNLIEDAIFIQSKRRETYDSITSVTLKGGLTAIGHNWLASPPKADPSQFRKWLIDHMSQMVFAIIGGVITAAVLVAWGLN